MQEAMAQVKLELGRDAVILNTRKFRKGGFLGFFGQEKVEVMAAVDNSVPASSTKPKAAEQLETAINMTQKTAALQSELTDMRELMEQVLNRLPTADKKESPIITYLLERDVDLPVAETLAAGLPSGSLVNNEPLKKLLYNKICNFFPRIDGITIPNDGCKTVALIGPTGVGKTTTIAKLAAHFAIKENCKVALITADTYRIAAVEQLKTYADILEIPIEIVYTSADLMAALTLHQDKDLVLIDTAGRSPGNDEHLAELQSLLAINPYIETHLVLSATTKTKDALQIIKKFAICAPQKLLFTKVDEASNVGTILNIIYHFPTILSYITTGQNVPDDIEMVNAEKLADLMLRD